MASVECVIPKNVEPFDDCNPKNGAIESIEILQGGHCIYRFTGNIEILHESEDKIIFSGSNGHIRKIYNKNGIIIINYLKNINDK